MKNKTFITRILIALFAVALLPIFAQDILHVGARGYGWLFAAPSTVKKAK